jgi:hypothetical protein
MTGKALLSLRLAAGAAILLASGHAPAAAQGLAPQDHVALATSYDFYALGFHTGKLDIAMHFDASGYRLDFDFRTAGLYGALFRGQNRTLVEGRWTAGGVMPLRYDSEGLWSGVPWITRITYAGGDPVVETLEPPREAERDPVPPEQTRATIDSASAMALLIRHMAETGRCSGEARLYDGRRLMVLTARDGGRETLAPSARSPFSGTTLRCDFEGKLIGGVMHDHDQTHLTRHGTAWFAALPQSPIPLPIRLDFETAWVASATMYLESVAPLPASAYAHAAPSP